MNKDRTLTPVGVYREDGPAVSEKMRRADVPSTWMAAPLRKRAKKVLDAPGTENRMTLILGILTVIGLGFAVPMILDCLLVVSEVLTLVSDGTEVLWPAILCFALNAGMIIFFTLPLAAALFRMAALMTEAQCRADEDGTVGRVSLSEIFYPFSSASAYIRTQLVAWRWFLGALTLLGFPVGLIALASWLIPLLGVPAVGFFLWIAAIVLAIGAFVLIAIYLCKRAGLGYLLFLHPEASAKELRQRFNACNRPAGLPLWLAVGHTGWVLFSLVAVCLPFVLHTIPVMLLTSASYGRHLEESKASLDEEAYGKDEMPVGEDETAEHPSFRDNISET